MNREIKFRAWSTDTKEMMPWEEFMVEWFDDETVIPMQFTGLKDKNGNEIYEGDLLKPFLESIGPYRVVFENGSFVCYHKAGRWGLLSRVFENDILRDYEAVVIGNIYENPELI